MDQDACVGRLTRRYNDNEKRIACLQFSLKELGEPLKDLASALIDRPSQIRLLDDGLGTNQIPNGPVVPNNTLTLAKEHLSELNSALSDKVSMEDTLRRIGLERLIQS